MPGVILAALRKLRLVAAALGACAVLATSVQAQPAPPEAAGEPCDIRAALSDLEPAERWLWDRVCRGQLADFSRMDPTAACPAGPSAANRPDASVRAAFLQYLFFDPNLRTRIAREGLRMHCVTIEGDLDLSLADFDRDLRIENSYLAGGLDLERAELQESLSLRGSTIGGDLDGRYMRVAGNLHLDQATQVRGRLDLSYSDIGANLDADGLLVYGATRLEHADVSKNVFFYATRFVGPLLLRHTRVGGELSLHETRLESDADFYRLDVDGDLHLTDAEVYALAANNMTLAESINLSGSRVFGPTSLQNTVIGGDVIAERAVFNALREEQSALPPFCAEAAPTEVSLDLKHADVTGNLRLANNSIFYGGVMLFGVHVGANTLLGNGNVVHGPINLSSARLAGNAYLSAGAVYGGSVWMTASQVDGEVSIAGSTFHKRFAADDSDIARSFHGTGAVACSLSLSSVTIGENAILDATRTVEARLQSVEVRGHLGLREAVLADLGLRSAAILHNIDLAGAVVAGRVDARRLDLGGFLVLAEDGGSAVTWHERAALNLADARVAGIQDAPEAWDNLDGRLNLLGFAYERFGSIDGNGFDGLETRGIAWIRDWLGQHAAAEPASMTQPYKHLVTVLRTAGHYDLADEVTIELNNFKRMNEEGWDRLLLNAMSVVDYGIRPDLILAIFLSMVVLGTFLFRYSTFAPAYGGHAARWTISDRFFYSLDSLLPAVTLRRTHDEIEVGNWVKYYFYFMKVAGYLFVFSILRFVDKLIERHSLF